MLSMAQLHYALAFVLSWWGYVFGGLYITLMAWKGLRGDKIKVSYVFLHAAFLLSMFLYASIALYLQYEVWFNNPFTRMLASVPLPLGVPLPGLLAYFKPLYALPHGYLYHYETVHVWLALLWSIIGAGFLGSLLAFMRARKPLLVNVAEAHFIVAGALVSGWPGLTFFIALLFAFFVLHSIVNSMRGRSRTVIFPSAICAVVAVLIFQSVFVSMLPGLQYLRFAL